MPPKKVQEPEKKPLIGRVGTNLRVGIVGVPNVGKSTFFNVLTKSAVAAENFPFCTIDPNENNQTINMHTLKDIETALESKGSVARKSPTAVELQNDRNADELYKSESSSLADFECDSSYIINYKYLKYIQSTEFKEEPAYEPPLSLEWYPFCNTYYNYTEDVDYVNRVNNFLTNKPSFDSLKSVQKIEGVSNEDPYSTNESQIKFLNSNPVSFLILGKPGIGECEVARHLADDWKCCYIDPKILIEEEMEANTRVGQCIEFNLRCGRAVGVDVILRLLNKRIDSQTAQHRGFVISGFPLIANDLYEEDPVSSESAIFTVHEIFEEVLDATIDIGIAPQFLKHVSMASKASINESVVEEEEQEEQLETEIEGEDKEKSIGKTFQVPIAKPMVKDLGSASFKICAYDEFGTSYEDQVAYIFSLCKMPLLLIYISCPNGDVVERRLNNRFNLVTKQMTNLQRSRAEKVIYTVFTKDANVSPNNLDNTEQEFILTNYDDMILPYDFPANVLTTLEIYRIEVLRHIENRALIHDPQYFIKLDGRYFPNHMYNVLRTKIGTLPIHCVVIPTDMTEVPQDLGPEETIEPFDPEMHTVDECFQEFHNKNIVGKMFKWSLSNWGYQCPVALTEARYEIGLGKYAVHFMNQIFFLSDEEAHKKFIRNPRKFVTPPYPKPNCKIFVIGPKHSGKTAVAKCLAYLLNGQYVCPRKIEADYRKRKQSEVDDIARSLAINEALNLLKNKRLMQHEEMENKRLNELNDFIFSFKDSVLRYEALMAELEVLMQEVVESSSFAIDMFKSRTPAEELRKDEIEAEMAAYKTKYTNMFNLSIENSEFRGKVLADEFDISKIIPKSLTTPHKLSQEVFDVHHPFVVEYVQKATDNLKTPSIEMQTHLLKEVFREALTDIEAKNAELGIACGGWVIDGMPINLDLFDSLKPDLIADDIIVLRDSVDHSFLLERFFYKGRNDFNDYRTFFMEIGKRDAAWRSPAITDTDSGKLRLVQRIIDELLDNEEEEQSHEVDYHAEYFSKHPSRALIKQYEEHLHTFDENYEDFIQYITEYGKNVVQINIANKEIPSILKEIVKIMDDKYRQEVYVQTPQDLLQEMEDFGGDQDMPTEGKIAPEDINEEVSQTVDTFTINRRLGDTNEYCPVAFHDFNVLWKGKEELAASFEKKIYFFSSEEAKDMFIDDPNTYVLKARPEKLPPPRIAIVGVPGSGKSTICQLLRQNYGLNVFEFEDALKSAIDPTLFEEYINTEDFSLPTEILAEIMLKTFTEEPFKLNGIIFSGFPRRPSDVAFMAKHGLIPDIVIELSCLQMEVYNRRMDKLLSDWKINMETERKLQDELNTHIYAEWEENKNARLQELINLKREERYFNKPTQDFDKESVATIDDKVSIDSVQDAEDMVDIIKTIELEFSEPIFDDDDDDPETLEEAIQRFDVEIGQSFEMETRSNAIVREACEIEQIPWVLVDANAPIKNVLNQILRVTDQIKFRNESLLERCYDVTIDTAERLMQNGYHFISRFGQTCPVQFFEEDNFIQLFNPLHGLFESFPIIYRNYIYFLAGKKNRQKFIGNPIKYVMQTFKKNPLIPFRLAVIGPPKCGKTTLAERFQRDLGFKIISVGKAVRYVLKTLNYTKLVKDIQYVLRQGWELTPEMAANCIRAMISDGKCITQGFVLDGFPNSREESKHLADLGIIPHLILDIEAPIEDVMRCLKLDKGRNNLPRFSKKIITHRFFEYQKNSASFRKWIDKEYQNITKIHITPCKWGVWNEAFRLTSAALAEVKQYYRNAGKDMALNLSYMLVTPLEFLERQHPYFKNNCPACQQIQKYRNGGYPPDRTGLVQYSKFFYWVCSQHIDDFRNTPEIFLPPWNTTKFEAESPKILQLLKVPDNVYNRGCCVVCFTEHLPARHMELGTLDYVCEYQENIYLFDTNDCLTKFMSEPLIYYLKSSAIADPLYPSLNMKTLPPMGLLEQYVAQQLITAITNVSLKRPVVPGLSISQSALICTGLFLKLNSPKTSPENLKMYVQSQKLFDNRTQALIDELEFRKKNLNPFLWYEEPLPEMLPQDSKKESKLELGISAAPSSENSMIGLIDEILNRMQFTPLSGRSIDT